MDSRACVTQSIYSLKDFHYDKELGIYLHPSATRAEYVDDKEDYIIGTLKSVKDLTAYSCELAPYIKDWPSRYHFSFMRNNLLEGIVELFDKNSTVLEISPECGAITRWLGERFKEVDAIEGDLQRAATTRVRTSELENVKVYFGDMLNTSLEKKYDIITLIGVLAYAPFYDERTSDPHGPCLHLLSKLIESLNDRGILVLAIENKLGLKYLSGCGEDHTGKQFDGIAGYPEKSPVTFSRKELEKTLRRAGFNHIQFYHLFPDHKLTRTIIAENDEVLPLRPYNWIKTPFEDYTGHRQYLLPEPLFLKTITDAGLLWHFSNSFLVLASRSGSVNLDTRWLIKKFNNESYDKRFHHNITLEKAGGSKYLIKRTPVFGNKPCVNIQEIEYRLENKEYICGELLSFSLYRALLEEDQGSAIKRTIKILHDSLILKYSTGKTDAGGYPLVRGDAVDYTLWNLVSLDDGNLCFIDKKWKIKRDIPADFVLFRNLFHAYFVVHPFLNEKSRPKLIVDMIRSVYPRYSLSRLNYNAKLEEEFQSIIHNKTVTIRLDDSDDDTANKSTIIFQKMKNALEKIIERTYLKTRGSDSDGHKANAAKRP